MSQKPPSKAQLHAEIRRLRAELDSALLEIQQLREQRDRDQFQLATLQTTVVDLRRRIKELESQLS